MNLECAEGFEGFRAARRTLGTLRIALAGLCRGQTIMETNRS